MWPTYGSIGFSLPFSIEYPLSELRRLGAEAFTRFPAAALFMGNQAGCIGTGAPAMLLAGGIAGILLGFIPWRVPVAFFGAMACTAALFPMSGNPVTASPLFHICTGFSFIGAFFLAADVSSRPVSRRVMIWYGAFSGALTVIFRMWSGQSFS